MKGDNILSSATQIINKEIVSQIKKKGHSLTGALENSVQSIIYDNKAEGYINSYGSIVNEGVRPEHIPYGGNTHKGGGKSKYIESLISYFKKRGFEPKVAERLAFATAKTHKKEGMSTKKSARFSSDGKRQHFLEEAFKVAKPSVDKKMKEEMTNLFFREVSKFKSQKL